MRFLDRFLLFVASGSLLGVVAILVAGEISPKYISSEAFLHGPANADKKSESALVEFPPADAGKNTKDQIIRLNNVGSETSGLNVKNESEMANDLFVIDESKAMHAEISGAKPEINNKNPLDEDIVILNREIDAAIEQYFETIRRHPEKLEEENRLVTEQAPQLEIEKSMPATDQHFTMKTHIVQKGESIWRIAQTYNVPVYTITSANPNKSKRIIRPGDKILVPNMRGVSHKVRKGETLGGIARRYKVKIDKIKTVNALGSKKIYAGSDLFIPGAKPLAPIRYKNKKRFIWPVRGRLTSGYGWRKHPIHSGKNFHSGIDIGAPKGTKIMAAASGVVVFAGNGGGYGKMVILKHKDNYFTVYAHASKINVRRGQYVKQGRTIAKVGSTGLSTGAHLHFEVKRGRKVVNPAVALKKTIRKIVKY